jgi:tryptophan synthase alpha chain
MSRIAQRFEELQKKGRKGLIVYVTAGCPDFNATLDAILAAEQAGADIIEIGIPFSDPMADGPVIQKAAQIALKGGATTAKALHLIRQIRLHSQVPLVVMTYVNTVLQYGPEAFTRDFAEAGLDGLIVPDLPSEEALLLEPACRQDGLDLIQFVAPTTSAERAAAVCRQASGFIYAISSTGVTGVRDVNYQPINQVMTTVRQHTQTPLAIGFGIGTPEAATTAAAYADAVIVGSAIMERLMDGGVSAVAALTGALRQALDGEA